MSLLGIIVAMAAYMIVGMVWYSKALFGPTFFKLSKVKATKPSSRIWLGAVLNAFVISAMLSYVSGILHVSTIFQGISTAMTLCIGFTLPALFSQVLWAKMPAQLFCLHAGCFLVSMGLMGGLLAVI